MKLVKYFVGEHNEDVSTEDWDTEISYKKNWMTWKMNKNNGMIVNGMKCRAMHLRPSHYFFSKF